MKPPGTTSWSFPALHHRQLITCLHYLGWALVQKANAAILGL